MDFCVYLDESRNIEFVSRGNCRSNDHRTTYCLNCLISSKAYGIVQFGIVSVFTSQYCPDRYMCISGSEILELSLIVYVYAHNCRNCNNVDPDGRNILGTKFIIFPNMTLRSIIFSIR